jgi:hypothetical protein
MFQKLVSHNDDIKRLVDKGYAVAFDSNYMVIRDIPYLDEKLQLQVAAIVAKLEFKDAAHVVQDDHQVFFSGSSPYNLDGTPIRNLGDRPTQLALSPASSDVVVQRRFSNKPRSTGRFADFFEKIESYVNIISGPAIEIHGLSPYTFRAVSDGPFDSVFKFNDTLTSRAEITDLSARLRDDVVAVIGLGGTGSYLLDFLSKTPVKEIRAYDADKFHVHNAFRSPGRLDEKELGKSKAEVYRARYENFRHKLTVETKLVDSTSADDLNGVTFAFICVDKGTSRGEIFDLLLSLKIPFIDVGMGLNRKHDSLNGMMRTTYYSVENGPRMREMGLAELADNPNDEYRTNVQIGELNALNACMAVIRFKQIRGFYFDNASIFHHTFKLGDMKTIAESDSDEI